MQNYSRLLISEPPLQVLPSLAVAIGLNEAIALQQLHYWISVAARSQSEETHFIQNQWWVYNTVEQWRDKNFPFWCEKTIRTVFRSLEKQGLVKSAILSPDKRDRTKWYSIDYQRLGSLPDAFGNSYQMEAVNLTECSRQILPNDLYTERSTERSTEIDLEQSPENKPNQVSAKEKEYLFECKFGEFWKKAVKKKGKGQARRAFRSALKKIEPEALMKAWEVQCKEDARKAREGDSQFIKHPSSWLNGECWEDEGIDTSITDPKFEEYTDANGYIITATGYREPGSSIEYHGSPPDAPAKHGSLEKHEKSPQQYERGSSPMDSILAKAKALRATKNDISQG